MNFWTGIFISTIFLIATIVIFSVKVFFPYHRVFALTVYMIGWIPFLYSIFLRKKWILENKDKAVTFLSIYYIHIIFGLIMILSIYILITLFPLEKSVFIGKDNKEIARIIKEDKIAIIYLDKKMSSDLLEAKRSNLLSLDFKNITGEEKEKLRNFWIDYIEALLELDLIKNKYSTFYQLNTFNQKDLHRAAFDNGYNSLLAQNYYVLELVQNIDNKDIIKFFNQKFDEQEIPADTFDMLKNMLTNQGEILRLNAGRTYRKLVSDRNSDLWSYSQKYLSKIDESINSYSYLAIDKPLNFLEKKSFKLWFPIQKELATEISYIKVASRDYLIDDNLINQHKDKLLPGDILLERREWHATNIGISGFWTHSALYLGTIDFLNEYFQNLPELDGKSFEEYIKINYPKAFAGLNKTDAKGNKRSVIESKRPGVVMFSLNESAHADSLAVLRVKKINQKDRFKIVLQALSHFGKPYDFDFDFVSDNALVCSELVYKAYDGIDKINIEPNEVNGRIILSPNQYAEKFFKEYNQNESQLDLVLFLDGNEKEKKAISKGGEEFSKSWLRPKWHLAKDFIDF